MMQYGFDITYVFRFIPKLLDTLDITLLIVTAGIVLGLIAGLLVALPRLYKVPILEHLAMIYVSFFRGTPILILLFLFYYGLPEILKLVAMDITKLPVLYFVVLTFGLYASAYIAENIRAAVLAVSRGQVEAAYAIGMTGYQAFTRIVMPQALAISVPVFSNLVLAMLKDTSLAFTLGVMELTGKAETLGQLTQHFIETYLSLALIYFVISMMLERVLLFVERKLRRYMRQDEVSKSRFATRRRLSLRRLSAEARPGQERGIRL